MSAPPLTARERWIRNHSGWRKPLTWIRERAAALALPFVCRAIGHNWDYPAFTREAFRTCSRCYTVENL